MPPNPWLSLTVRESKRGGPWGHKFSLSVRVEEDMLVWDLKALIFSKKQGYEPQASRLYYLGVPMANCRTLKDYHVANLGTLHIMRGTHMERNAPPGGVATASYVLTQSPPRLTQQLCVCLGVCVWV